MTPPPSTRLQRARHEHAFTMLEALLALFIFSTAVISLVEAINDTGRTVLVSRRERDVQARLHTMLLETTRSPELLSKMKTTQPQESSTQEGDVSYITRTAPLQLKNMDGLPLSEMMSVTISARWQEGREPQEVSAETWVYPRMFMPESRTENP